MHPVHAYLSRERTLAASPIHTRMQACNHVFVVKYTN